MPVVDPHMAPSALELTQQAVIGESAALEPKCGAVNGLFMLKRLLDQLSVWLDSDPGKDLPNLNH